jgi:hypothetical protein
LNDDNPEAFELRHVDDDSDCSSDYDSNEEKEFYKPLWDLPALEMD